jgi:signal transduction histidine kinase
MMIMFKSSFQSLQLRLAIFYSAVMGSIFLCMGYWAHNVMQGAFNQVVDRELTLLSKTLNDKLSNILTQPEQLPVVLKGWCQTGQVCTEQAQRSDLAYLVQEGYCLELLNLQGQPIAAIGRLPGQFPVNSKLQDSYTAIDQTGQPYHLHLFEVKTAQGQRWGYLQVGRSLKQLDTYMMKLHLLLIFGIPLAMVLIGGASWWLAGLAMQPIYQSYERMQQFTADAAHELRTPIATNKAILETALTDTHPPNPTLEALQRQTDRLEKLAQDLLLLSRLETAQEKPIREMISLHELLEDLVEELAPLALAKQIELDCQINSKPNCQGNASQLYRLFSNLIQNAIKYSPANTDIKIILHRHRNQALISIRDRGVGIPATDLPYIFDRFYRIASDRHHKTGGTGLGLAIAQSLAQKHGGKIRVMSEVGLGSEFIVSLPI